MGIFDEHIGGFRLSGQFIHWVKLCVTTASFLVQVNGELTGYFGSERGLRQGCSLLPYLFVISMNVLSKMLDKAALDRKFGYHPKCKNIKLTHLCFADDLMVFTDGRQHSMEGIISFFDEFVCVSGLHISIEKSTLYMAGVTDVVRQFVVARFPFEEETLPVRYLGLQLLTKSMKSLDYTPLIEKIRLRTLTWMARFLSYADRLQLLSSVIASLTNFWMSTYRLSAGCIKEVEKICSAFLWSGPDLNSKKQRSLGRMFVNLNKKKDWD